MNSSASRPWHQRGAALLLLMAVLGVGAASLFVSALGHSHLEARRELRTQIALARAQDALIGYAIVNGRLPRPATSAVDGTESPRLCGDEADCTGFLPWATLGIDGTDAWGKLLRYSVTPVYTVRPLQRQSAVATKTVQSRDSGGQPFYRVGADLCDVQSECAPAVVYSTGRNNFGTSTDGRPQANGASGNYDEQANNSSTLHFIQRPASDDPDTPGGSYDDMLAWVPLTLLYNRMSAAGSLP